MKEDKNFPLHVFCVCQLSLVLTMKEFELDPCVRKILFPNSAPLV